MMNNEFNAFAGSYYRMTEDGSPAIEQRAPVLRRAAPLDPRQIPPVNEIVMIDDVGPQRTVEETEQALKLIEDAIEEVDAFTTTASAWYEAIPDHTYTTELKCDISDFLTRSVMHSTHLGTVLNDVVNAPHSMPGLATELAVVCSTVSSSWSELKKHVLPFLPKPEDEPDPENVQGDDDDDGSDKDGSATKPKKKRRIMRKGSGATGSGATGSEATGSGATASGADV